MICTNSTKCQFHEMYLKYERFYYEERFGTNNNTSNDNDIETKANESFDNGLFFDIEAKQTHLIVRKLFMLRSEPISFKNLAYRSKAKHVNRKLKYESCEAKRTCSLLR